MKKSLVIASLLAIGTSAMALDSRAYIGAGLGASWSKNEASMTGGGVSASGSEREDAVLGIIKGGVILNEAHRLSLAYAPSIYDNVDVDSFLASYDYLISTSSSSRVYLGLHAGYTSVDGKDEISFLDASGASYGAQLGYIYDITKNVEFEIGAMYTAHDIDKKGRTTISGVNVDYDIKIKDTISTFVGINYKF